ncbi:MAG: molybdenum ABC transporter ATP-binding protein [Rhodospirillales bacterium]|nr:MAG: molybdenum ABC transporter ATP-binding protein [Rhodospirillales bacterium]
MSGAAGVEARFRGRLGSFLLDATFNVPTNGVTALFGPSGCGKTTVLRCMAGLLRLADGRLSVDGTVWQDGGRFIRPHRRPVGYVFQEASLFPHLSVVGNLRYGLRRSGIDKPAITFDDVVDLLGIARLLDRPTAVLSGGERQRVAIGRALLSQPRLLLMDEPLAALDRFSKDDILPYLERLHGSLAIPVFYVSHDLSEVERLADTLVLMQEGRVRATGPLPVLVSDPALPFVRMPDAAAVLDGVVMAQDAGYGLASLDVDGATLQVPGHLGPPGTKRRVRVLASDVSLTLKRPEQTTILNALPARVAAVEDIDRYRLTVILRLGRDGTGAALLARVSRKSWETLALDLGLLVHAQIKGVALLDGDSTPDAVRHDGNRGAAAP